MQKIKAYGICLYKVIDDDIKILLCKSVLSNNRWGFLKGVKDKNETNEQTAKREFLEESSIDVNVNIFEEYFEQINIEKDIGIYLVNYKNIKGYDSFFIDDKLENKYLCKENSEVKFFNINELPLIKKKQSKIALHIIGFLQNKNQSH